MGVYFVFMRPALLPEDLLYMKTISSVIKENIPTQILKTLQT
jgi:hypothetical protein